MLIKEYRCKDCNTTFESLDADPACPTCTGDSERAFLTPPAINSSKTSRADTIQKELAADFGMSNMSNRNGAVKGAPSDSPAQFGGNSKIMQNLAGLGAAGDNFSQVMPTVQRMGNPRSWSRTSERRK